MDTNTKLVHCRELDNQYANLAKVTNSNIVDKASKIDEQVPNHKALGNCETNSSIQQIGSLGSAYGAFKFEAIEPIMQQMNCPLYLCLDPMVHNS